MVAHLAVCSDCSAPVRWVKMRATGKSMPVNPVADPTGNVAAIPRGARAVDGRVLTAADPGPAAGERVYRAHWADCPRGQVKKPRSKATEQPALFG